MFRYLVLALTISLFNIPGFASAQSIELRIQDVLQATPRTHFRLGRSLLDVAMLRPLYAARNFQPIWVRAGGRIVLADALYQSFQGSVRHGLKPENYFVPDIVQRWNSKSEQELFELDLILSQAYVLYASDLHTGRLKPSAVDSETDFTKRYLGEAEYSYLQQILVSTEHLKRGLEQMAPQHSHYRNLQIMLARLKATDSQGGWPALQGKKSLKLGMSSQEVPLLRKRLSRFGYLPEDQMENGSVLYDQDLFEAFVNFQRQHNLEPDGILGPQGRRVLNTPISERIQQIVANMERWRWLPPQLDPNHVMINLARAELTAYEGPKIGIQMRIVIGKQYRRTPSMVDKITRVIFNPYWHVPHSLAVRDILPSLQKDPTYLQQMKLVVFSSDESKTQIDPATINWNQYHKGNLPFSFRQEAGPNNALGVVKFDLTNHRAIYLHDTNHKELFVDGPRNHSSGCIRLERPLDFAEYLLKSQSVTREEIDTIVAEPKNVVVGQPGRVIKVVSLDNPLPVYIGFFSASFDEMGRLRLNSDVYGQDSRIFDLLNRSFAMEEAQ